jgi:hypothetical protein
MRVRTALVGQLLLVAGASADARAQSDGFIAVGGGVVARASQQADVQDAHGPAFVVRVGPRGEGWGPRFGFNWYSTQLDKALDGEDQRFGSLRVRPLLIGYGYTTRRGSARVSFNLKAGYAITSFRVQRAFSAAYGSSGGAEPIQADASNALVLKPEVDTWIDLSRKLGLNINTGYLRARPTLVLATSGSRERQRVRADMFLVQVGVAYSIF